MFALDRDKNPRICCEVCKTPIFVMRSAVAMADKDNSNTIYVVHKDCIRPRDRGNVQIALPEFLAAVVNNLVESSVFAGAKVTVKADAVHLKNFTYVNRHLTD